MPRTRALLGISLVVLFACAAPASAVSPDVVISQVYGGGGNSGATLKNDFIELFNRGTSAVDVGTWSVQYGSATGTTWQTTSLTGTIPPGGRYLVQESAGAGGTQDLPTPDATGGIAMAAGSGKVALVTAQSALACGSACASNAAVRDFVGYGTANDSETVPTPTLSNTTAAQRLLGGCTDTDNNSADFVPGAPSPRNSASAATPCAAPPTDDAPAVTDTDPAQGASDVPAGTSIEVTFSEPVSADAGGFTLTCGSDVVAITLSTADNTTYTVDPQQDLPAGRSCTLKIESDAVSDADSDDPPDNMAADYGLTFTTTGLELRIHDIQGARHISPYDDALVSKVPGVVTAVRNNGFYYQDAQPDGDARTSEGIFVFTSSAPPALAVVGSAVLVSGRVSEFRPGGATSTNLTITEIVAPTVAPGAAGAAIPHTVIGDGGRIPPSTVIDNDSTGDVETNFTAFDPAQDGIDFYESLEAMLVQVNDPVAVGPSNDFGETWVLGDKGRRGSLRTPRGGIVVRPGDFNPERIQLDDLFAPLPKMNVGDRFAGAVRGVMDYEFGNFNVLPLETPTRVAGGLAREVTATPRRDQLAVATFNVENLDPGDGPAKFEALAEVLVNNLRSPDLVSLEEIQDNTGPVNDGTTDATLTYNTLIAAIVAKGGPTYEFRQIDPVNNQDGGEPGGNIRVGFLFRTDRGLSFVDRAGGTSVNSTGDDSNRSGAQLTFSPGRIKPTDPAFNSSRKPLAGEFRFRGRTFFAVANHFNSKGGDDPLFGRFQPPKFPSEEQRGKQAQIVNEFAKELLKADRFANIVVLGDLNDFDFSDALETLEGRELFNLAALLPRAQRYSYVFEGNSQILDQILVSYPTLLRLPQYDSVHVNSEFFDQISDHDPQLTRLWFP